MQILGQVVEVVDADSADHLTVKFDKYQWMVNMSACQLVNEADRAHIHVSSGSDDTQHSDSLSLSLFVSLFVCPSVCLSVCVSTAVDV